MANLSRDTFAAIFLAVCQVTWSGDAALAQPKSDTAPAPQKDECSDLAVSMAAANAAAAATIAAAAKAAAAAAAPANTAPATNTTPPAKSAPAETTTDSGKKSETKTIYVSPNPLSVQIDQNSTVTVQATDDAATPLQVGLRETQFATLSQSSVSGVQAVNITVHGTMVGRTCLTVTSKKGDVVITVPVHVFEAIAPRFQITTAFASSRVPNRTFSSIPSPMPAGLTFRDLLNENSDQRNGAAIMAHARLTETPAVNVYATLGAFTGTSGGYIIGASVGYKNAVFVTLGSHFTSATELNPRYSVNSTVPAGMASVPTVTVQRVAPVFAIGITLSSIGDVLSGKNPAASH